MKGDDGKISIRGKGAAKIFDGSCRNCGVHGRKSENCWATGPTEPAEKGYGSKGKKGKQVDVLDERVKAGTDADKDIGRLSNALCAVRFEVMSDDVEIDWTGVMRDHRSGRHRQVFS